jgi:hypothetical protein
VIDDDGRNADFSLTDLPTEIERSNCNCYFWAWANQQPQLILTVGAYDSAVNAVGVYSSYSGHLLLGTGSGAWFSRAHYARAAEESGSALGNALVSTNGSLSASRLPRNITRSVGG